MSTEYPSKNVAIIMAFRFAGVDYDPVKLPEPKKETKYHPLDSEHKYPEEIETYTIKNRDGENATFAIGKFRDGFDLWLVTDNGFMVRT